MEHKRPLSERFKRFLSGFLIFTLLFGQTVHVPLLETTKAAEADFPNLVAVLVPESLYSGDIDNKLERYGADVQASLAGSRVSIVTIPDDTTPEKIAALLEKLYYEGDGKGTSRLVGTVLVGELPIPVVHRGQKTFLSVFPYVDFVDKSFVYRPEKGYYEYSDAPAASDTPEIWHGIVRSNTGDAEKDRERIGTFFDKTHDFYTKSGVFEASTFRKDPHVFYFDSYRDQLASRPSEWKAYQLMLRHVEDLAYKRYNKHLAKAVYDAYQGYLGADVPDATGTEIGAILAAYTGSSLDFKSAPDIQTREPIEKTLKNFFSVLNEKYLGDIQRFVHNAGRYGVGNDVRADVPAVIVGKGDELMKRSLKDANTALEAPIDSLVYGGLARNVAVGLTYKIDSATRTADVSSGSGETTPGVASSSSRTYRNYIFGKQGADISAANQCTIVRGSTLPVEANRGYDVTNSLPDMNILQSDLPNGRCFPGNQPAAMSFWGNNSPLKLDVSRSSEGIMTLKSNVYDGYIKPTFDMGGAKEIVPSADLPIATPYDCTKQRLWISDPFKDESEMGASSGFPVERPGQPITCITDTVGNSLKIDTFEHYFNSGFPGEACTTHRLVLDGAEVKEDGAWCDAGDGSYTHIDKTYSYKKVLSVIEHKSPTDQEYGEQLKNFVTPSLPVDRDRYVDFISAKGNYVKIQYPNLFRITFPEDEDLTAEKTQAKVKEVLDAKSAEINAIIGSNAPSGGLAEILKNGAYPSSAKIDLYGQLAAKPEMLQSVIDAVLWNNLTSATSKYAFILEHHLDIDGNSTYPLAGHKSDYEVSYVVGKGTARDMYVRLDPEAKNGPVASVAAILAKAAENQAMLDAANVASGAGGDEKAEFKCGPPDGVVLWEWMPAIFCWLSSILPPTVTAGSCSPSGEDVAKLISKHFGADKNGNGTPDYQEDLDGNGIVAAAEYVKDGNIRLTATPKRAAFRESVALSAILEDKDSTRVYVDSTNEVSFDVARIVAYSGGRAEEAYRRGAGGTLGDYENVKKFVNFSQINVRVKDGEAKYSLSTKDRDADVYFDATVSPKDKDGRPAFVKVSPEAKLEIRAESIQVGLSASGSSSVSSYVRAGEFSELVFPMKKTGKEGDLPIAFPVTVRIVDDETGKSVADPVITNDAQWKYSGGLLKQSGTFRFEFTDKTGTTGKRALTVTAGKATKIELVPSSTLFVKNEPVTVLVRVLDQFGNYAKGDLLELSASVSGGGFFTENKATEFKKHIVEGYSSFEISTSDGGKELEFKVSATGRGLSAEASMRSLDYAKAIVEVADRDKIVVGKEPHAVSIRVVDKNGATLNGFGGVAAVSFPKLSGSFETNFVRVTDGLSGTGLSLTPKFVAGENLSIDVRIPGIRDVEGNRVTVYPDVPMRVSLETEKVAMEAKVTESQTLTAKLFDRYGNLAYNHAENAYAAKMGIEDVYRKNLRFPGKTYSVEPKFVRGVATATVEATRLPGTPYVTVEVVPGIESNSFTVTDRSGKTLDVRGYSKNAVVVDTYYLWNKEKVAKSQYNALYTVLGGADFGNFTEKDYLAGELLFNPGSRSMAVTAVLNDATAREKTFSITPAGKVEMPSGDSLVTAEISSVGGKTSVGFYDPFYREYVARAYLNFAENAENVACKWDGARNIENCQIPAGGAFVLMKGYDKFTAVAQNGLALVSGGNRILEIGADGAVSMLPNVRMEVDKSNSKNLFAAKIFADNTEVGYFAAKLRADSIVTVKSGSVAGALAANPGKIVVEAVSSRHFALPTFLGNSSRGAKGVAFYSTKDSDGKSADRDLVGGSGKTGFEEYRQKEGIGWEGQNKTLLEFAGGSSVGEATRFNMSFSTVNLGDPVLRAKKLENQGAYDRSIGTRLLEASGDPIESYKKFDFNGDSYEDLVVFLQSGKIRLFANVSGTLRDMGYLAYVSDAGKARKGVGDFAGDGYDDIAAVTNKGDLIILDNREGKFTRKTPVILAKDGSVTTLLGRVVQLETYDMDQDGKTDIVVSDESGELNILYGEKRGDETVFVKNRLDADLALRLSGEERKEGGAIYFDGLPQLSPPDQATYLKESEELAAAGDTGGIPPEVKKSAIDSKIYYLHAYKVDVAYTGASLEEKLKTRLGGTIGNDPNDPHSTNSALMDQVLETMSGAAAKAASGSFNMEGNYPEERLKTFLRSEWAEDRNIVVKKAYQDASGDVLRSGDPIDVVLSITNSGSTTLKNVAYFDSFEKKIFSEPKDPTYVRTMNLGSATGATVNGKLSVSSTSEYDYLFEGFDLRPGETATIRYSLVTNPVSFGKFVVGRIETDDVYGDVAMQANNVCGEAMTLWKTIEPRPRSYQKTTRTFESNGGTAGGLAGKFIDANANGQPDYIDVLATDTQEYYTAGGTLYDASAYGLLLFRETVAADGTVNSGNIEVARLVANAENGNLQRTAEPGEGDVTLPVDAGAVNASYSDASKTLSAGSLSSSASASLAECGKSGYKTVKAPRVIGWKQVANAPSGQLDIFFSEGTHSKDGGKTVEACRTSFSSSSSPSWSAGAGVVGNGWKILTKHTYNAYALAAKQADFNKPSTNVPDDYDEKGVSLYGYDPGTSQFSIDGLSDSNVAAIEAGIDEIVQGLGCGFGGGACLSMPFNWAPLAPGTAPTAMGFPLGDLIPGTGLPLFSALTGMPVGPYCIPSVWPPMPLDLAKSCGGLGAGGWIGDSGAANFFRFYLTPTITGAVGIAACFGVIPSQIGKIPPQTVSPVVPGGNCIVAAKPLLGCKDDGSDGDVSGQGMANPDGFFNANSCKPKTTLRPLMDTERQMVREYVRGNQGKSIVDSLTAILPSTMGPHGPSSGPLVGIGAASGEDPNFEVGINTDAIKDFDVGNILKIKLDRVSAFPDFIMDWVNRQTEEVVNKLTSLPTLYIILPDFSKIYESGWNGFGDKLKQKFDSGKSDYQDKDFGGSGPSVSSKYATSASQKANSMLADNKDNINTVGKNISGLRTAYEFMSGLPIIQFETETLVVDVPMISDEDIDKAIADFNSTKRQWTREIGDKKAEWSKLGSKDGVNEKLFLEADATVASIDAWSRFLEDAKRFPDKLYRYLTWKQRYAEQILCNVEQIEQVTGGYIAENGQRFRAWVELYVMIKAILKSWQLIVDLFYEHTADCGVCRNERYDLKHFMFKIISAVMPKIPIIKFPKWPDIVIDLHSIRLGLRILMPEFDFHVSPFVLPTLPNLNLPNVPSLGLALPALPPPPPFPELPDMPDLPSLPMVKLPDLPPPPKIPKLFSAIEGVLKILKLVSKILCILRKNPFVPEWRAGDQIAQITERQGKMAIDFFDIEFPNFPVAFLDAIKVSTFVNLEFQVDFILEMAKSTFQPVNEMSTDLRNSAAGLGQELSIPSKIDLGDAVPQGNTTIDVGAGDLNGMKRSDPSKMTAAERKVLMTNFAWTLALSFKQFVSYLDTEKDSNLAIGEFRTAIAAEAAKLAGDPDKLVAEIAEVLGRAASYDSAAEERLAKTLAAENSEKFRIVKDAVRAEIEETKALKAKIEELRRGKSARSELLGSLGKSAREAALAGTFASVGEDFESRGSELEKFTDRAAERLAKLASNEPDEETETLKRMGDETVEKVASLTAETAKKERALALGGTSPLGLLGGLGGDETAGTLENGQTFHFDAEEEKVNLAAAAEGVQNAANALNFQFVYQGIYVKDEGRQTRLFDYVEELNGGEEAILIDTTKSGNGKEDVVYSMGDSLYLKKNLKSGEAKFSNDSVSTYDFSDLLPNVPAPTAPNYFRETFVSSNQINFRFEPARPSDRKFRIEFYDYVDRFDRLARGDDSGASAPKRAIDLFADLRDETVVDSTNTGAIVRKNVAYVDSASGEGEVTYPEYRTLSEGESIGIAVGRTVYVGGSSARIRYAVAGQPLDRGAVFEIPAHGHVEFLATGEFKVEDGEVYLFDVLAETKTSPLASIKGLPLLPDTRIVLAKSASKLTVGYHDGGSYQLRGPAVYGTYDLGKPSPFYGVSVSETNDWYYSRLTSIDARGGDGTTASLLLLSPQIQADKEGPLVEFPTNYRIPVYSKENLNMKKYLRDVSGIKDFFVDVDPTTDRDGNKTKDDDRDSDQASTGSGFVRGKDWSELSIGPFDAPKTLKVRVTATDTGGNATSKDVTVTVFAPTPTIESATSSSATGSIDSRTSGEPVDVFRFRGGKLSRLSGSGETFTDATGKFGRGFSEGENLTLSSSGKTIASVNEKTGKIEVKDSKYSVSVEAAKKNEPMTIRVSDAAKKAVYWQSFALPATAKMERVEKFSDASGNGTFVRIENAENSFVRNAPDAASLPGGAFLIGSDHKPFAGIGRDGNVYLFESGYSLSYRNEGDYVVVSVRNGYSVVVAEILYRIEAEYVIK